MIAPPSPWGGGVFVAARYRNYRGRNIVGKKKGQATEIAWPATQGFITSGVAPFLAIHP
jgi:hypothetical protein